MQATTTHNKDNPFPLGGEHRLFLGGNWVESGEQVEIRFPYDRSILVGRVAWATGHEVEAALELAREGARDLASSPLRRRSSLLHRVADLSAERGEPLAWLILHEVGKPNKDARLE